MSPGVTPGPKGRVGVILSYPSKAEENVSARERRPWVRPPHRWTTRLSPPPQKLANSITFRPISVGGLGHPPPRADVVGAVLRGRPDPAGALGEPVGALPPRGRHDIPGTKL